MREICTSGSVGAPGRKSTRGYPTNWPTLLSNCVYTYARAVGFFKEHLLAP
jgi:hypothetical protein